MSDSGLTAVTGEVRGERRDWSQGAKTTGGKMEGEGSDIGRR